MAMFRVITLEWVLVAAVAMMYWIFQVSFTGSCAAALVRGQITVTAVLF